MHSSLRKVALCAAALLVVIVVCVKATNTYYVNGTYGNNTNDGLTAATAKKNISAALAIATSGDVIQVESSVYQETNWLPSGQEMRLSSTGPVIVYQTDPWQTDSVGDGVSDGWRQYYFGNGTTTNQYSCASCDPEGDGAVNLAEYLQGRDPTKGADPDTNGGVNLTVFTSLE